MRSVAVWSLLLLQASAALATNARFFNHKNLQPDGTKKYGEVAAGADYVEESPEPPVAQPGFELVDAALAELSRLPQASHLRKRGPQSIFSIAFQYLLRTIPSGPVTAPSDDGAKKSKENHPTGPLGAAVQLLNQAAHQNNSDALFLLAEFNFFGNFSHPRDLGAAFGHYEQLASTHGNTTAQYMLGLYYSTGIGNVVPKDQAKALLYYTFAALRGNTRAEMATAFRHQGGIGTTKNCENAVKFYKRVADKAIRWYRTGPPGGRSWAFQGWRISDDDGGVYGEGASASSSGLNAYKPSVHSDAQAAIEDVIEYLDLMSQKGDSKASFNLGRIYYEGQRGLQRDFDLAKKYFFLVASRYWRKNGQLVDNYKLGIEKTASKAAGFIGRMYLRGDGVNQNFDRARIWFERGITQGDAQSQWGLGVMLLNGYGGKTNVRKAMDLFKTSAEQEFASAQVQMGQLYLDQGGPEDLRIANNYFELALRHGNIEANYYLAEMIYHGVGREKLCNQALSYYKNVAEKAEPLVSSWGDANNAYEAGEHELAFLEYLMAAEQGYERAQTNVAFMLDTKRSKLPTPSWLQPPKPKGSLLENKELSLIYWTRSSRQSNVDSLVKMGDYYFYGIGTERDIGKAVQCYTGASDYSQSAQALFNLGWMHENGIGLNQDFHLAKRYYDHALQVNDEAYLPVTLSLLKLRLRSAWNTITHGPVHSIQDEPEVKQDWSLSEWISNFLQDDGYYYEDEFEDDGMYSDAIGAGGEDDFDDEGLIESVLIIGVTMSLVFLVWWRQRMQQQANDEAQRRDGHGQGNGQQQGNQGGGVGGAFAGWAAAGGAGL